MQSYRLHEIFETIVFYVCDPSFHRSLIVKDIAIIELDIFTIVIKVVDFK